MAGSRRAQDSRWSDGYHQYGCGLRDASVLNVVAAHFTCGRCNTGDLHKLFACLRGRRAKSARRLQKTNSELANRMVEGIDGMQVIRAFGREGYEQNRFDTASNRLRRIMLRLNYIDGVVHPVYEILGALLVLIILIFATPNPGDSSVLLVFAFVLVQDPAAR